MRTIADIQLLLNELEVSIRDAQAASSASTEGRSWQAQQLSALRNQRTAYIREIEALTAKRAGARNPFASRATWFQS